MGERFGGWGGEAGVEVGRQLEQGQDVVLGGRERSDVVMQGIR